MKKNIILYVSVLSAFCINLFALSGPHADITSSTSTLTDNGEICVYCHTPHAANSLYNPAPLWNKPTSTTVFTMYGAASSGISGVTVAGTPTDVSPSGASMACLSCHDGISAMNSVINAPGAGNYDATGSYIGTNPALAATMVEVAYKAVGLDGDMTDDHPISIEYIPGRGSLRAVNAALTDIFGASTVSDLLKDGKVQCTSCHDPHGTPYNTYLRNGNTNSELCIGCHNK
jgi:predicted CXXCH cytochrome family protein